MYSLAVAFLLTSSAFANDEEPRRLNWPSSYGCYNNNECKQIGHYCYTGWLGLTYCSAGKAVGSLCSTSPDCGYIGNRALSCISGVCYDSPSPSPSPSPGGCTSSEQCPKIGDFCYGEYSLRNGVCKQGNGLGSMCKRDTSCGFIGNRPVSCVNGICIDSGRRLSDDALPSVEPLQPEDDEERRRADATDVQLGYAPPSGTNCKNNYDCSGIGNYCYSGNPFNFCSYGSPIGSLCQSSYDCGYQGYTQLACKWGTCRRPHHPSPSPPPSPSGQCTSSEDCPTIGDFCYGEFSTTNGVCKQGNGLGSMCRWDSSCGHIGNRPVSCVSGICIDSGSSGIVYGRRLDNAQPSTEPQPEAQPADNAQPSAQQGDDAQPTAQPKAQSGIQGRFAPPKGFKCTSAWDCYRGQECVVAKPFNYCSWIRGPWTRGRRADDLEPTPSAGGIMRYPPPPGLKCQTSADCKPLTTRQFCFAGNPFNYCQMKNPIGAICTPWKTGECGYGYCSSRTRTCKAGVRRLQEAEESS